jgi:hypothetical protein
MNLQQAKITLEKINRLYQSMTLDSTIDEHEQQLMLNYIRQFYKAFSGEAMENEAPEVIKAPRVIRKTIDPTPVVQEIEVPDFTPEPEPKPALAPKPTPKPVASTPVEQPVKEYVAPPAPPTPTYQVDKLSESVSVQSDDYEELFEMPAAKELSDRLSATPIRDLTKAISINEKILTCNELFAKDKNRFDDALKTLNGFSSFSEARPYLANLANEFGWDKKSTKKKAQIFIKLVRRRYK